MRTQLKCLLIGLAGASLLAPAHAQWSPSPTLDMGVNYGQMALSQSAIGGTRALSKSSNKAIESPTPTVSPAKAKQPPFNPRFKSDPKVSKLVDQRFARYLASDQPNEEEAAAMVMRDLEAGHYRADFKKLLDANGLAANDLIDVTAAHYAALWEVVRGTALTRAQVTSIRNQLRQAMRDDPELAAMDDADRQEIAETFMLHTAAALGGYRTLQARGDKKLLAQYRDGVQRNMLPDGPDLKSVSVNSGGFTSAVPARR
ncbi:hypothetical protein INQ41_04690 [Lysobacter ciconiae]|uniref:Uncharacterized protein n=1 Tax=Novilysobacter ciconiae TaxID=2781022 RepID=A0A7S6ZSX6_9GAMM|nr:DUF6683 family protein [Lysobacter ciconiae]QOW20328.1 hypothetical protein INQ41_04690 [Lysobacter ciconiae]